MYAIVTTSYFLSEEIHPNYTQCHIFPVGERIQTYILICDELLESMLRTLNNFLIGKGLHENGNE